MPNVPRSVRISLYVYRLLLRVYPRAFRRDYGAEMTQAFCDLARDAQLTHGAAGLLRVWLCVIPDVAQSAFTQHCESLSGRMVMLHYSGGMVHYWIALMVALVVGMLVTPPDPLSQLAVGLPLFGLYVAWKRWSVRATAAGRPGSMPH